MSRETPPATSVAIAPPSPRPRGRPRAEHGDEAILDAAVQLLLEVGLPGTTTAAVAKRAGVARATVYLRWPTHDALIAAAGRHAIRRPPFPLSGDFATDLQTGSAYIVEVFNEPWFVAILPELVRAVLARPVALDFNVLAPNRERLADEYRNDTTAQGFRTDVDPLMPFDLILGAHLVHLLAVGEAATAPGAGVVADVVLAGLKATAATDRTVPGDPAHEGRRR